MPATPTTKTEKRFCVVPVAYKIDVLAALKEKGFSTYKLRQEKLLGESVIQQIRVGDPVSWPNVARLCELLGCQIGDILEYRAKKTDAE